MLALEKLFRGRPRILNHLHKWRLVRATSETNEMELASLARYAENARIAVEIGTDQGVSAARIASALAPDGVLFCVDPWPEVNGRLNPCFEICQRHLDRTLTKSRIQVVREFSRNLAGKQIPMEIEFAFIDGDHSWAGIEADWRLIAPRVVIGGVVCLHDTATPLFEPWRRPDSNRFYEETIAQDLAFREMETVHSMRIIRRVG